MDSTDRNIKDLLYATDKHKKTYTTLFMSALVIIVPNVSSIVEWITTFQYVHTMENCLSLRNNVPLLHTKIMMTHSNVILYERSHIQKSTCCMVSFIYNSEWRELIHYYQTGIN